MKIPRDYERLIKNILGLLIIGVVVSGVIYFISNNNEDELTIDKTPIHIESIREIAELSTVSYRDEVVVDSVIYYKELQEIADMFDAYEMTQRILQRNVKRRLTMIFQGEVKYGIDLTDKNIDTRQNKDTLWVILPKPEILDIVITPSQTEIYQEQGYWSDGERKSLENRAKKRLRTNSEMLNLDTRAKKNATKLFRRFIRSHKTIIVDYE